MKAAPALVARCKKFGVDGLALLDTQGETRETCEWLGTHSERIIRGLSDRRLKACEYAGGVLDVSVPCNNGMLRLAYCEPDSFSDVGALKRREWDRVRMILRELAGLDPIRTHARDRENWTTHWRYLYERGDAKMRADVVEAALERYPDFDVAVLTPAAKGER